MANNWEFGTLPSRRLTSRVETPEGVWVFYRCDGREDVAPIRDMSMGGVFLATPKSTTVGSLVNLHFLVEEGLLRAEATVRYVRTGGGMGLKFTAVPEEDRPRLAALMTRVRGLARARGKVL